MLWKKAWTIVLLCNTELEEMGDKKLVCSEKLAEAVKLPNSISVLAKHCGITVGVPLEDNIFRCLCTYSFILCSYIQTTSFTVATEEENMVFT